MKDIFTHPFILFCFAVDVVLFGLFVWIAMCPDIQADLRAIQNILFWWQQ